MAPVLRQLDATLENTARLMVDGLSGVTTLNAPVDVDTESRPEPEPAPTRLLLTVVMTVMAVMKKRNRAILNTDAPVSHAVSS
jgi:hypothetical protein